MESDNTVNILAILMAWWLGSPPGQVRIQTAP